MDTRFYTFFGVSRFDGYILLFRYLRSDRPILNYFPDI